MFKNIDGIVSDTFLLGLLSSIELKNNNGVLEINKDTIITQTGVSIGITASSMFVGAWGGGTTYGVLTHKNFKTLNPAKYAILQDPIGRTYVSGENVNFAINGTIQAKMTSSKMLFNYYNTDIDFQVNTLNSYFKADAGSDRFAIGCSPSHWIDLMPKSGQAGYMRIYTENDVEQGFRLERNKPAGSYNASWINYIPNDSKELRWYNGSDLMTLDEDAKLWVGQGFLGTWESGATYACFSHKNFKDTDANTKYAMVQSNTGETFINSYDTLRFVLNGTVVSTMSASSDIRNSNGADIDFEVKDDNGNYPLRLQGGGGENQLGYFSSLDSFFFGCSTGVGADGGAIWAFGSGRAYNPNQLRLYGLPVFENTSVPATATSPGRAGQRAWDANYIYQCVATDTWKRTAIATW